ncbi:MAG: DUF4115 domain-containing protein [Acidiferrobacterales bacterium]|nr:DUF4115 domain-containing protein [Acidiferrobacterales bacterium]
MNSPAFSIPEVGKTPSPGELLRAKREEYGWGAADVARALRLSEVQVHAIERDDYASLPGKTYVMGYWRSYSQLLKISIDESIQIHRAELGALSKDFSFDGPQGEANNNDESSRKRTALLFAVLLVVVLGAIWYWQNPNISFANWVEQKMETFRTATTPSPEPLGEIAKPEPIPDAEFSESVENQNDIAGVDADSGAGAGTAGELVLPAPSGVDSVLALPVPNFSGDQNSVEINTLGYTVLIAELPLSRRDLVYQPAEEDVESEVKLAAEAKKLAQSQAKKSPPKPVSNSNTAKKPATQPKVAAASSGSAGEKRIVFNVAKESWIDVRDSTGERLIYRTVNRGEAISLKGTPPYSVFIGSAEGVSVQYQGAPVPFKAHESGLFARFEVGQ